jgi:hypothetical protein
VTTFLAVLLLLLVIQWLRGKAAPALVVHGNFLLVALTGLGIMRYTLAMWPGIMVCGAFLVWFTMESGLLPKPQTPLAISSGL